MPKPRPDFLGLMDVMQQKAEEIQNCRHEVVARLGLMVNKGFTYELVECQSCKASFWRKASWPEVWEQLRAIDEALAVRHSKPSPSLAFEKEIASSAALPRNDKIKEVA